LVVTTTTADELATNGLCSLREAIINSNNDNQSGSAACAAPR
jgi:CSLREA domain-containing protein